MDDYEKRKERQSLMWWFRNEIRRNMDFIEAIDRRGRYFMLTSEDLKDNVDYYLDDFISDEEFDAITKQLKSFLLGNVERYQKSLEKLENEEKDNIL